MVSEYKQTQIQGIEVSPDEGALSPLELSNTCGSMAGPSSRHTMDDMRHMHPARERCTQRIRLAGHGNRKRRGCGEQSQLPVPYARLSGRRADAAWKAIVGIVSQR
jgi:hypothetical protein